MPLQMQNSPKKLLFWPDSQARRKRTALAIFFMLFFYVFYGGAAWAADFLPWRFVVGFSWERDIPFIPESAVVYISLVGLMLLALFSIREYSELRLLVRVLCIQILIAVFCFMALPVGNNYQTQLDPSDLPPIFLIADAFNLQNNEVPSLHVCFAFTLALVIGHYGREWQRILLIIWALAIALSAMTMHEHNLVDVVCGLFLAFWGVVRWRSVTCRAGYAGEPTIARSQAVPD